MRTRDQKKRTLMGRVERYMFLQDIKAPAIMVETELDMVRRAAALLEPGELAECFAEFPSFAARRRREREEEGYEFKVAAPLSDIEFGVSFELPEELS